MTIRVVSASRVIAAPPAPIFDLLADPSKHPLLDGSGSVGALRSTPERLTLGSRFSMSMRLLGLPYTTKNIVSEFAENRVIAWHHVGRFVWRYELEVVDGGTEVTESFDYSPLWGISLVPLGIPEKNRASMELTLERLDQLVTTGSVG